MFRVCSDLKTCVCQLSSTHDSCFFTNWFKVGLQGILPPVLVVLLGYKPGQCNRRAIQFTSLTVPETNVKVMACERRESGARKAKWQGKGKENIREPSRETLRKKGGRREGKRERDIIEYRNSRELLAGVITLRCVPLPKPNTAVPFTRTHSNTRTHKHAHTHHGCI